MRNAAPFSYALDADKADQIVEFPLRERPASASDDQAVKDQEDKTKIEAREASAFWRAILSDQVGKREVYKLLIQMDAFDVPFAASPIGFPDTNATFFKAGKISAGQILYQMLAITARAELFKLQDEMNIFGALAVRPDKQI